MTESQLAAKADAERLLLARWSDRVAKAIDKAVAAAHAHATVALTETLKRTPDGRQTIRKASQSPSYGAACNRLDELWQDLTGPSVASLRGLLRSARADFYLQAFDQWNDLLPEEFLVEAGPTSAIRVEEMRRLVLHGMDLRTEIGAKIDDAKRSLLASLEQASRKSTADHVATDLLDRWRDASRSAITRSALLSLGDAMVLIDGIAANDAVKPEYRRSNEYTP